MTYSGLLGAGRRWVARGRHLWLLAGILLPAPLAWGQSSTPTPWQADPVLSTLLIHQLVPDSTGYLWAATDDGVRRYDGYAAVPLAQLVRGPVAAPTGYVRLAVDRGGRLWVGSSTGLAWLAPATGQLTPVPLPTAPTESPTVRALWLDARTGRLWVGYGRGRVLSFDPGHPPRPGAAPVASPTGGEAVLAFAPGPTGEVWVTAGPLLVYTAQGQLHHRYPRPAEYVVPLPGTRPRLLLSATALFELDTLTGQLRARQRWLPRGPYEPRFGLLRDAGGRPAEWLAGGRHFTLRWPAGPAAPQVASTPLARAGGPGPARRPDRLYELSRDRMGLLWASTFGWRGSFRQGPPQLVQQLPEARPQPNPSTRGITRLPDGRLLVDTRTQAADSPQAPLRALPVHQAGKPWPYSFYHLLTTRAGRVLFALEENGFGELDLRTSEVQEWAPAPGTPVSTQIRGRTVYQDRAGRLWGGGSGLYQLDEAAHRVRRYRTTDAAWPLHRCEVRSLSEDAAGTLWLATSQGLYAFDPATDALRHYGPAETDPTRRLPVADLLCVLAGQPGGQVWVGTRAAGLLALVPGRGVVRQLGPAQGMPDVPVATLLPGPGGTLWAGTYAGLVRYAPALDQLMVLGPADGLAEPELNQQAAFRDRDGTLYFGGIGGVVRVLPAARPAAASPAPRLLLTARALGDSAAQWLPAGAAPPPLRLAGSHAGGGFDLALTDFRAPDHQHFYYRLRAGARDSGVVRPTGHQLRLRGLAPGTYELELWGQAADGRRTAPVRVALTVGRPWWQHPAALLGGALVLVLAGAALQQLRSRRALREARLRTRIAADLHDEVGALLTRVSMRAELLHETSADPAAPDPAVAALLADSRSALATMRDVVWSIDAGADTVGALLDRLRDHLDQSAEPAGLRTSLDVAGLPDATPLPPQLRQHLYLLAKEAITNAVRHAQGATELRLALRRDGRTLTLTVADDGQPSGRPARTGGMGLRSMQQRAAALGGQLMAGPASGGGWEVKVVVGVR
ncbi:MAG: sensor histidine kinase [Janthinobacterium lividum]